MRHSITLYGAILIVCFFIIFTKSEANQYVPTASKQIYVSVNSNEYLKREIKNTLKNSNMYSEVLYKLLLGTAATESEFGQITKQTNGPALGIFQIEPRTANDIWLNYLSVKPKLKEKVESVLWKNVDLNTQLQYNVKYQILLAAINYRRVSEIYNQKLPKDNSIWSLAWAYKKFHNTKSGKGTTKRFFRKYKEFVSYVIDIIRI